ncbi:MAG: hypothetical protein LIO71_04730 [Ruminococcus sp.]|nr:hypothetical protein [Ruminococcus sp.]
MKKYLTLLIIPLMLSGCVTSLDSHNDTETQTENVTELEIIETSIETYLSTTTPTTTVTSVTESSSESVTSESSSATTTEVTTTTNILSNYGDDEHLISLATSLYNIACEMAWNYYNGSPYSLDYDSSIEDEYGGIYFLIDDENIHSLEDVHEDWFEIFSSQEDPSDFDGHFIEKDGKVYVNDGTRGADVYYKDTEITEITSILGDGQEVTFNAVSHYIDPEDNSPMEDEIDEFSIILEDGSYHVGKFKLPY